MSYGRDNLYPNELMRMLDSSPLHGSIVEFKTLMVAGAGITLNGLGVQETRDYLNQMEPNAALKIRKLLDTPNSGENLHEIVTKISADWQIFGALAIEITWSRDFSEIARIKHIPVMRVRSGKICEGNVEEYFYSRDWSKFRQKGFEPVRIPTFDRANKEEAVQLLYHRRERADLDYYGSPSYNSALGWINIHSQMALYHNSNIKNGFNPSFVITFNNPPPTPEGKQELINKLKKQFGGAENTGKAVVFWNTGGRPEDAPKIEPVNVSNINKQFTVLQEQVRSEIISGHRITSQQLIGISTAGQLGATQELETAYKIFQATVITPDQLVIEKIINKIFRINGVTDTLGIAKFNPLQ